MPALTSCASRWTPPRRRRSRWCAARICSTASFAIVRNFTALQRAEGATTPLVSLWLTGLKETVEQLAGLRPARGTHRASRGPSATAGSSTKAVRLARADPRCSSSTQAEEGARSLPPQALAHELGVRFDASGATEPGTSLKRAGDTALVALPPALDADVFHRPWPGPALLYRAVSPCTATTSFTLGNATQQTMREIWNGEAYQDFRSALLSDRPPQACASCGLRWSL